MQSASTHRISFTCVSQTVECSRNTIADVSTNGIQIIDANKRLLQLFGVYAGRVFQYLDSERRILLFLAHFHLVNLFSTFGTGCTVRLD